MINYAIDFYHYLKKVKQKNLKLLQFNVFSYILLHTMPPYRLKIPKNLLAKENKLKIVVTNTSSNWYVHTDYFDKWTVKELSPYFETELDYAKDSVSGGLYGPVVLYTE